jgi:1-acyl-sn-glycerol-3-phosphate acyltransferase
MAENALVYFLVRNSARIFFTLYNRFSIRGIDRIPPGPLVVAANHASNLDPVVVGSAFPRPLRYLAKEELFRNPLFGALIDALGAVPVAREDRQRAGTVLKMCLEQLASGRPLLLFPEGTRSSDGRLKTPLEQGAAFLSLKSGAPIVPAYLAGSFESCPRGAAFPRPAKLRLLFGHPLRPEESSSGGDRRGILTARLTEALEGLQREARS